MSASEKFFERAAGVFHSEPKVEAGEIDQDHGVFLYMSDRGEVRLGTVFCQAPSCVYFLDAVIGEVEQRCSRKEPVVKMTSGVYNRIWGGSMPQRNF
jgi:hypothetical protein